MPATRHHIRIMAAGAAASFVGVGLGRFAYNPLFPYLVADGWITPAGGAYIGAFNLAGYLCGVLMAHRLGRVCSLRQRMNGAFVLMAASFLGCAVDAGLVWLCLWRLAAGLAGGILMVLAGPAVQSAVPAPHRGLAGGAVIAGVGAGIVLGAVLSPLLPHVTLFLAWLFLAALTALLWGLTAGAWPRAERAATPPGWMQVPQAVRLVCAYGLAGAGMVPHMVYLSDLLLRGYGMQPAIASAAWLLFGLGAILGAMIGGRSVDALGGARTMRVWLALQSVAVGALLIDSPAMALMAGALGGFAGIGMTGVALGYARRLSGAASGAIWTAATGAFAIAQAVAGFFLARLFSLSGSALPVLIGGLCCCLAALALMLAGSRRGA